MLLLRNQKKYKGVEEPKDPQTHVRQAVVFRKPVKNSFSYRRFLPRRMLHPLETHKSRKITVIFSSFSQSLMQLDLVFAPS